MSASTWTAAGHALGLGGNGNAGPDEARAGGELPRSRRDTFEALAAFVAASRRLLVLTGAGVSTSSGIPDYRDEHGRWKHSMPIMYQAFLADAEVRRRYWARSMAGWRRVAHAEPNAAHRALADLERLGVVHCLITQNIDGLHARAGSKRIVELHGCLDEVECLACARRVPRTEFQRRLEDANPGRLGGAEVAARPDGDAGIGAQDYSTFAVPSCTRCGGAMKPCVVFFGESVPRARVSLAMQRVAEADALLVVGSSLMVFSGFRFVREAARLDKPIAAVNLGRTRADDLFAVKVSAPCGATLERLAAMLGARSVTSACPGSAPSVSPR